MSWGRLSPESRGFVVMLSALTALAPLGIDTSLPALPVMARALHTSDFVVQATLGAFMLAFALGQLLVGPLSDRYGRRPTVIAGMALFGLAGIVCATARDGTVLVAARFLQGVGACAGAVAGRAIVRDVFRERVRAAQMQAYASAISGVVPMLAPLLGAALLPLGWRAIYAALVAGGALLLVATAAWLPETLAIRAESAHVAHVVARYRDFLALPRSPALCVLLAASFAGLFTFISGSPFVLVRELGLSNAAYGVAFAISSGAIMIGSWTTARLARRVGPEQLLRGASFGAAVVGCGAFALNVLAAHPPAAWQFVAVMAAYAFTFGIIVPSAFAAGLEPAGAMAGVAAGMLGATQMLGGSVGSILNGALPFRANVGVGLSVGIAGLGVAAAYVWSARAPRAAGGFPRGGVTAPLTRHAGSADTLGMEPDQLSASELAFDSPQLGSQLDALLREPARLDELNFGLIAMDLDGIVVAYNSTEATFAGVEPARAIGISFFEAVAPCTNNYLVAGRFEEESLLDETIAYVFTVRMHPTPVTLRLLKDERAGRQYLAVKW